MISLNDLKTKLDKLAVLEGKVNALGFDDFEKAVLKSAIVERRRIIKKEIEEIEYRERTKLAVKVIDGQEIEIPEGFHFREGYRYFYDNGILYALSPKGLDKDGSFHYWGYAWIEEKDKCVSLIVTALGNDRYGDRIHAETYYYKDKRDGNCYLNKLLSIKNYKYKLYINKIVDLIREHNDLPDFLQKEGKENA